MNPEIPKSASIIKYEELRAQYARQSFYLNPNSEIEAIAKHYAAHATIALHILEILQIREQNIHTNQHIGLGDLSALDDMILHHIKLIKTNHLYDFGIQLEWHPNSERK